MKIDINKIATLAKLPLSEEEKTFFEPQLNKIVEFVEKLKEVDTSNVEPTFQVTGKVNELRADEPIQGLSTESALQNSSQKDSHYFVTKGVFENS